MIQYIFLKEIDIAIMILYKNTKTTVRSPDGNTDFFDKVTGDLQRDTFLPYLFILCQDHVLQMSRNRKKKMVSH